MTIYIPYILGMLREETEAWARERDDTVVLYLLDQSDPTDYWYMLSDVWTNDNDIVIVEQDMVPAKGVVDEMLACDNPWCTSPYKVGRTSVAIASLGCTKFSLELRRSNPDLMRVVGEIEDGLPAKDWRRLDVRIAQVLRRWGYQVHSSHRPSRHLHYEV